MSNEERAASMNQDEIISLLSSHQNLQEQLDWFKRQLFGSKSERHITPDDSLQLTFGELAQAESVSEPVVKVPGHERRLKSSRGGLNEGDLRFDDTVPVEQIFLPSGIAANDLNDYEKIGEKSHVTWPRSQEVILLRNLCVRFTKRKPTLMQSKTR